jgi:hypothetical protein
MTKRCEDIDTAVRFPLSWTLSSYPWPSGCPCFLSGEEESNLASIATANNHPTFTSCVRSVSAAAPGLCFDTPRTETTVAVPKISCTTEAHYTVYISYLLMNQRTYFFIPVLGTNKQYKYHTHKHLESACSSTVPTSRVPKCFGRSRCVPCCLTEAPVVTDPALLHVDHMRRNTVPEMGTVATVAVRVQVSLAVWFRLEVVRLVSIVCMPRRSV